MPIERKPRIVAYDGGLAKGRTIELADADSLLTAVTKKDKKKLKALSDAVESGKIIRIM